MDPKLSSAFSLEGETALITGGGTGIGFAIADCFVRAGARVVIVGRREEELQAAVAKLGDAASHICHDVTMLEGADELVKRAGAPVSILVNNAGNHLKKRAIETSPEEFQSVMETHVLASHALTRAVLPGMIERGRGNILFTASMASIFGIPQVFAYTAAKAALAGMTRALAVEVSDKGIRVNSIAPGWIETPMTQKSVLADPPRFKHIIERTPMGRMGEPADIGWAAVYLCSSAAKFVTGSMLVVDGGISIGF